MGLVSATARPHNLGSCHGLAHVPLRVVGDVDEQTAKGRRQMFQADYAHIVQPIGVKLSQN